MMDTKNSDRSVYIKKSIKNELKFPDFDDIKVSTKTCIVVTNIMLDIKSLFEALPITDYIVIPKKRGRKKKNEPEDPNKGIPSGSIITLEYENNIRGVDLKKKKKNKDKKKRGNYFRNSVTVVMIMEDKKINFKISRNGKFQMTGCRDDTHSENCVKFIWNYIKNTKNIYKWYSDSESNSDSELKNNLKAIFIPAMRNIDFGLGFYVDRERLDEYFNRSTNYNSLLETSFGYTGVNIKIPMLKPITDLMLKQLECCNDEWIDPVYVDYMTYINMLSPKEAQKKLNKQRHNTFLVFHSGKTIFSGMDATFMKDTYYEFINIIRDCYDIIEERLEE